MGEAKRRSEISPDQEDWDGDEKGFLPVSRLREKYIGYLTVKVQEYEEQKLSRHYYHGAQWTPEEIRVLRQRRQPIITFNEISTKIDNLVWIAQRFRADPKAYPRNPKNASGAEIATQCVRAVLDGCEWTYLDSYCAGQAATEGIGGIELKLIEGDHGDPDISADFIFGDDFFYDPTSFKPDFSDARYKGISKWLHEEAAIELFPDKEDELRSLMVETGFDLTTHADREFKWVYANEHRVRLVEHWYKNRGKWHWAFYVSNLLLDQGVSPFVDHRKRSTDRFIMFSAAVDHDGDRYGFVRNLKGPQDEVNQRRSKALHISNTTRLIIEKGSVDDVETTRREAARPDGVIEFNKGFEPPAEKQKDEDLSAHLALMQDARQKIVGFANIMPDRVTAAEQGEHSGVAIDRLQKAASADLGTFLRNYKSWKMRVYRAVWSAIQHNWKAERYIRVNAGNDELVQFLQINALTMNEWGQPTIQNLVGSIDVDIVMDEGPDTANLMQDAYEVIKDDPTIPWQIKLEFMPMPASFKASLTQKLQQQSQQPDPKAEVEKIKAGVAQQKGQFEVQKSQVQAQAEVANAQQDAMARQQDQQQAREQHAADMRMEVLRVEAEREKIRMQIEQARQQHIFDMAELREQHITRKADHEMKRKEIAARPKQKAKASA